MAHASTRKRNGDMGLKKTQPIKSKFMVTGMETNTAHTKTQDTPSPNVTNVVVRTPMRKTWKHSQTRNSHKSTVTKYVTGALG